MYVADLEPSELPSDQLLLFYVIFEGLVFFFTLILLTITVTTVLKSTTRTMSRYKYYLLHELFWSFLLDLTISVMCPVSTLPVPCFYSTALLRNQPPEVMSILFYLAVMCAVGKAISIIALYIYRFVQGVPPHSWMGYVHRLRDKPVRQTMVAPVTIAFIAVNIVVCTPMLLHQPDQAKERRELSESSAVFADLYARWPSTTCFGGENYRQVLSGAATALSLTPAVALVGLCMLAYNVRAGRENAGTYRMQLMLFRSLCAQMLAAVVTLMIPTMLLVLGPVLNSRNNPHRSVLLFCVVMLHTPADCFMILAFIRPYRNYVLKTIPLCRILKRSSVERKSQNFVTATSTVM